MLNSRYSNGFRLTKTNFAFGLVSLDCRLRLLEPRSFFLDRIRHSLFSNVCLVRIQQEKKTGEKFIHFFSGFLPTYRQATTTTIIVMMRSVFFIYTHRNSNLEVRSVIVYVTYIDCFTFKANSKVFCNVLF